MIEVDDEPRIAPIEAASDQLLVAMFGPELFTDVTPGKDRVAAPGYVLVVGRPCVGFAHVLEERGTAHLQQLAVDPAHGRRGLWSSMSRTASSPGTCNRRSPTVDWRRGLP
jgi:ribosomal protein S18 acetylase RimI-like enzyme